MNSPSQILACSEFEDLANTEALPLHHHHRPQLTSYGSADGSALDAALAESGEFLPQIDGDHPQHTPSGDGSCKVSSQKGCDPSAFDEKEHRQFVDGDECACGAMVKQDVCIARDECGMNVKQDGCMDTTCRPKPREGHEVEQCVNDVDPAATVHVDVNACISKMDTLSMNAKEGQEPHVGQGELSPMNKDIECAAPHIKTVSTGSNAGALNPSNSEEQSSVTPPSRKPAAWRMPEPKPIVVSEPEFIMEASSWPTLAEARHAKPTEAQASLSHKETIPVSSSPTQKVPPSQETSKDVPKHINTNSSQPGPKHRSSYKKGGVPGYGKPNYPAAENVPVHPMGVHVPNAAMFNPDQSMKGNPRPGMNNFFPGPPQGPANGPFYVHRGEGLAPFPHNSVVVPPYSRGHPGWQNHSRGYTDANFKHTGFLPAYDQQHIGPRPIHPPMAPFMNFNAAHYNYPNFPGDMSYMPPAFSPVYNYPAPYFGPSGHPGGLMQGYDMPTLLVMLRRQIEYYFSKENLIHDVFLTSKMDDDGFVPLSLIASFPRVRNLTTNSMLILEALKNSSIVEVKNGRLRSNEWRKPSSGTSQSHSGANIESFAPLSNARQQGTEESGEGSFDKMNTFPDGKLTAGSCATPWTGLSVNLGTINVPAANSIDSR